MSWDGTRPWVVVAAGPSVGPSAWAPVAAALVATGGSRVAVVVVGPAVPGLLRSVASASVVVPVASRVDDVVRVAAALVPTHDRVLVTGPEPDGFSLVDVARALRGPVVVAAGPGTADEVARMLDDLERRHVPAAVVAVGPADDLADLPVALAGTIPADAADVPDLPDADLPGFAERAAEWLDPLLTGVPAPTRVVTAKRLAVLATILVVAVLQALYMVSLFDPDPPVAGSNVRAFTVTGVRTSVPTPVRGLEPAVPVPVAGCTTAVPAIVTTRPDAATSARVGAAWARIEAALGAKAPLAAASLKPGASPNALAATQARMGVAFPPDLAASLLRHDGTTLRGGFGFPPFHRYVGLDELYSTWLTTCRILIGTRMGVDWWNRSYVPFTSAGDGGSLVADARNGRIGDYYPDSGTLFDGRPPSVTALLEGVAASLETGAPFDGRKPVFKTDGTLDWTA